MALGSMLLIFTGVNPETDISRVKMICEVKLQKYKIITVLCLPIQIIIRIIVSCKFYLKRDSLLILLSSMALLKET
jgi:hypothetical protein